MPHWMSKAALQGVLSLLPNPQRWNYWFQQHVAHTMPLDRQPETVIGKLTYCALHLEHYQRIAQTDRIPDTVLELGTGWFPIVPVGPYLCGVPRIITVDIISLLRPENVRQTLQMILRHAEQGTLKQVLPLVQDDRIERLKALLGSDFTNPVEMLGALNIECLVEDARATSLPDGSVNLFVSNNTLEHIPAEVILDILREFRRIAAPNAVMSHSIDMADHYSYFDRSITPFNFFRYSESVWRIFNNSLQYQNRLRFADHLDLNRRARFVIKQTEPAKGSLEALQRVSLSKQFQRYSQDDLLILSGWILSVPDASANA